MFKNTASKLTVFCWDTTTGLPKTGDSANLTAYRSLDFGTVTVLGDTSATEIDSTNAKGYYLFDLTAGETNGDINLYTCKSSTANIACVAVPAVVHTIPQTGLLAPATLGRTLVVDGNGLADANMVKLGPSGSGTAQTARDIGASVLVGDKTGFSISGTKTTLDVLQDVSLTQISAQVTSDHGSGSYIRNTEPPTVSQIWTTTLPEDYAADGANFTGLQALYEICQVLSEFAISGTTITVKKRDGSTTALTFTLNDATTPTSRTRAT